MKPTNCVIITLAREFARAGHDSISQRRKYTGEPYWKHTNEVAETVAGVLPEEPEAVAAAELHDLVEDVNLAPYNLAGIYERFGDKVAEYVDWLTDKYTVALHPGLNREERKILEAYRLSKAPASVQTIKVADMISNTASIAKHDPKFALVYLAEKRRALDLLKLADPRLVLTARAQIDAFKSPA